MKNNIQDLLNDIFWTEPTSNDDSSTTDPLGLDAMREELSDKLVPCLTSRTSRHEDFFWTLTFLKWASSETTEKKREECFLSWERCLKIYWVKFHRNIDGFPGIKEARKQASGPLSLKFKKLLKMQRAQGMLGAHLGPLRQLSLAKRNELSLEEEGLRLVEGVGDPPELKEQDESWKRGFDNARKAFDIEFKLALREKLHKNMPQLFGALSALRWKANMAWGQASKYMGPVLGPYAKLAHVFCPWAYEVRALFDELILVEPGPGSPAHLSRLRKKIPSWLSPKIPPDLKHWDLLKKLSDEWKNEKHENLLVALHKDVFLERNYSHSDLWISIEDGRLVPFPSRAGTRQTVWGSDCRWSNAVALLRPIR